MLHYSRNVVFVTLQSLFIMALSNFTVFLIFDHCELLAIFQIRARLCVVHGQTVWSSMYVKGQFFLPSIYNAPKSLGGGCLWNLLEHFSKMSIESTLRTSWWLSSKLGLMCLLLEKKLKKENDLKPIWMLNLLWIPWFSMFVWRLLGRHSLMAGLRIPIQFFGERH